MTDSSTTEIALSKQKLTLLLGGSLLLAGAAAWMAATPETFIENPFLHDPAKIRMFGILGSIFFAVLGFFLVKKLGDKRPGLLVAADGFTDNSSGLAAGEVLWADVAALEEMQMAGQKFVLVKLRDPNKYIEQHTNRFKKQLLQTNLKSYGSPIFISANTLQCSHAELTTLLTARLAAHRAAS
ncbi:STM3941 family protein [Hymenobacter negativus]|uniref:Uncharacterized protein n=1 Tax=Hymenobacter negativus TaxID=2795026 RepID=A0ABS3QF86_9BACT|nr:STM3941 family protein [Hymenobacter negativus]MBO2009919.1 hypothetical protein [Hymenobacter negativus]